jgi:hypothetical protein
MERPAARDGQRADLSVGAGAFTIDFAMPQPDPPPVTTIAWRIGHMGSAVSDTGQGPGSRRS